MQWWLQLSSHGLQIFAQELESPPISYLVFLYFVVRCAQALTAARLGRTISPPNLKVLGLNIHFSCSFKYV